MDIYDPVGLESSRSRTQTQTHAVINNLPGGHALAMHLDITACMYEQRHAAQPTQAIRYSV
eukprot:598425-Pleurochrysis_carterae.AAC.5